MQTKLPVKITEAKGTGKYLVLMISGDSGWTNFDQQIAAEFAANGMPVVGLNSLKYFWKKKSPAQTTEDVLKLIKQYLAEFQKDDIILVGYSFGADVVPFIYNLLPLNIKSRIKYVGLLSPSKSTDFEVHVSDWLNLRSPERAANVPDEIAKMGTSNITCFFGKKERKVPVSKLAKQNCRLVFLEGGHHYKNSFKTIYKSILFQ